MIPLTYPAKKIDLVDSKIKDIGQSYISYMLKVINPNFEKESSQGCQSMRCPKFNKPLKGMPPTPLPHNEFPLRASLLACQLTCY